MQHLINTEEIKEVHSLPKILLITDIKTSHKITRDISNNSNIKCNNNNSNNNSSNNNISRIQITE